MQHGASKIVPRIRFHCPADFPGAATKRIILVLLWSRVLQTFLVSAQDGVYVENATTQKVDSEAAVLALLARGSSARTKGETLVSVFGSCFVRQIMWLPLSVFCAFVPCSFVCVFYSLDASFRAMARFIARPRAIYRPAQLLRRGCTAIYIVLRNI